jgi:hypothetical protein
LFVDIPWQKTGRSIAGDPLSIPTRAIQKLRRIIKNLGMQSATENRDLRDYPNWLRSEPAWSAFTQLLGANDALYRDYISGEQVARALEAHRAGRDASTLLFRAATFELWLQQSLGGKYRAQWP